MKLHLARVRKQSDCTIGMLSVDEVFECYTLEDVVRAGPKVFGQTAIPAGTYQVIVTHSPHFGRDLPLLVNVPGFEGVRIHPGNTAADTEGCILVGQNCGPSNVGNSRLAFEALFSQIQGAIARGETVTIEVA